MPRRNRRASSRVRQEDRLLRVRGVRRGTPDAKRLSRAFIGLALARAEAEAQAAAVRGPVSAPKQVTRGQGRVAVEPEVDDDTDQ